MLQMMIHRLFGRPKAVWVMIDAPAAARASVAARHLLEEKGLLQVELEAQRDIASRVRAGKPHEEAQLAA
jgi:hypothetical protein